MTKPRPPSRSPPRDDDRALWEGTASTLEPLKRKKPRVHPATEKMPDTKAPSSAVRKTHEAAGKGQPASTAVKTVSSSMPAGVSRSTPPPLSDYDRRKAKKLGRGQHEIEARIDLHGMRQSEAHAALRRFLISCHGRGLRHVLVITGKGAPGRSRDPSWESGESPSGVLRRNVPLWLAEPDLRALIVSFTTAALRHGGDGALYVHLRSRDKLR